MTFDKQEHKDAVLALLQNASFPGHLVDQFVELRDAVANGVVMKVQPPLVANDGATTTRRKRAR